MIIRHTTPLLVSLIVTVSSFSLQRNSPWRYAVPPLKRQGTRQHIHQATPTLKRLRVAAKTDNDDDQGTKPKRRFSLFFFKPRKSRFEKFVDKLFESADTNNDGSVSLGETYEMVLQMYVKLNRQAPIPPPSRQKLYKLFRASDVDRNDRISREEFTSLAKTLGRRAMTRLVAHKAVTLIGAPLLATEIVQIVKQQPYIRKRLQTYAAALIPDPLEAELLSASFARTALIIIFVATLGNITIGIVNLVLDLSIRDDDDEEQGGEE